jgi:hypothetical protein
MINQNGCRRFFYIKVDSVKKSRLDRIQLGKTHSKAGAAAGEEHDLGGIQGLDLPPDSMTPAFSWF